METNKQQPQPATTTTTTTTTQRNTAAIKREIIEHYDRIQCQIDIRTETLLANLPEALRKGREELLERVREEKEKSLASLAEDSPLVRYKNEYYERFCELKKQYEQCSGDNDGDETRRDEIVKQLDELKKNVQLLEEFLDDFKNRTLCFDEPDKSVYAALIGELVTADDLKQNESLCDPTR